MKNASIFINSTKIRFLEKNILLNIFDVGIEQIMLPLLMEGMTLQRCPGFFPWNSIHQNYSDDILKQVSSLARSKNTQIIGYINLLQWESLNGDKNYSIFNKNPELYEKTVMNYEKSAFASPLHPRFQSIINDYIDNNVRNFSELSEIVLHFSLPIDNLYAFNEYGRELYIKEKKIDPIDIFLMKDEEKQKIASEWQNWRLGKISNVVGSICKKIKKLNSSIKISIIGQPNVYNMSLRDRNRCVNDWFSWLSESYADEVIFYDDWSNINNIRSIKNAVDLVSKINKSKKIRVIADLRKESKRINPIDQFKNYNTVDTIIFSLNEAEDIPRINNLCSDWKKSG